MAAAAYLASFKQPTRTHYGNSLKQWYRWCEQHELRPLDVQRAHIDLWARELEEVVGNMASTVVHKLTAVCGFYEYAQRERFIEGNPAQFVRRPKVPTQSTTNDLTREEVARILAFAEKSCVQDHAVLCVLAFTGIRVGELCALKIGDVGKRRGQPLLKIFREKEFEPDEVPLVPLAAHAIDMWLASRRGETDTAPLFLLHNGEPLDARGANRIVKRVCRAVDIERRITCHSFRHTFISLSLDAGGNQRDVQHSVGHKDLRSMSRYDHSRFRLERNTAALVAVQVMTAA